MSGLFGGQKIPEQKQQATLPSVTETDDERRARIARIGGSRQAGGRGSTVLTSQKGLIGDSSTFAPFVGGKQRTGD